MTKVMSEESRSKKSFMGEEIQNGSGIRFAVVKDKVNVEETVKVKAILKGENRVMVHYHLTFGIAALIARVEAKGGVEGL